MRPPVTAYYMEVSGKSLCTPGGFSGRELYLVGSGYEGVGLVVVCGDLTPVVPRRDLF